MSIASNPVKLNPEELETMAHIMAGAFSNHQNWVHTIPKKPRRVKALKHIFKMMFRVVNEYGYIFTVMDNDKPIGYITYMDVKDEEDITIKRVLKTKGLPDFFRFIGNTRPKSLYKFYNYMKAYSAHKNNHQDKSVHLYSTGIEGAYRGKGIMGTEFRKSFQYFFDRGYQKIVLETSDESNIKIYQKIGFKIKEVIIKKENTLYFFELEQQVE